MVLNTLWNNVTYFFCLRSRWNFWSEPGDGAGVPESNCCLWITSWACEIIFWCNTNCGWWTGFQAGTALRQEECEDNLVASPANIHSYGTNTSMFACVWFPYKLLGVLVIMLTLILKVYGSSARRKLWLCHSLFNYTFSNSVAKNIWDI